MNQPSRTVARTAAVALLLGGLAGQASADNRRPADTQAVVVAPDSLQATPAERLVATRREIRAIVVDTGLASVDVTEVIDYADDFARQIAQMLLTSPTMPNGLTVEDYVAGKVQPMLAAKGLPNETVAHLGSLVLQMTHQQFELGMQATVDPVNAPSVEESVR